MSDARWLVTAMEAAYEEIWARGERAMSVWLSPCSRKAMRKESPKGGPVVRLSFPQEPDVAIPVVDHGGSRTRPFVFHTEKRVGK